MGNSVSLRDRSIRRPHSAAAIGLQPDVAAVSRFTDRLAELTSSDWLSVHAASAHVNLAARVAARSEADAIVRERGFGVHAWNALDDVQTVSQCTYAEAATVVPSNHVLAQLRIARDLAAGAALALLVRAWLNADEFDALYRPFAFLARR